MVRETNSTGGKVADDHGKAPPLKRDPGMMKALRGVGCLARASWP
jgi:hypothetical protein